ncbi:MAG: hypothetical protein ACIAQF_04075 [Phycisphaerales bacterium JB065]
MARIRREAPGVFRGQGSFEQSDRSRVFEEPGPDAGLMTQPLSIDGGATPGTTGAREPITGQSRPVSTTGGDSGWAILLERVAGEQHAQRAAQRAALIGRALGRTDVRTRQVSSGSAVVLGSYPDPEDQRAQSDLDYIKSLTVQGTRPYAMALLVPPPLKPGSTPQYDLTKVVKTLEDVYTHTLQVAVFAGDESVRRADAERYAQQLRREGVEAFYYHGRRVSSVTIGTFTARDFDLDTGYVSPRLERLQERYPHNLYNGEVLRDQQTGEPWNSALVQIPRVG